MQLVASKPDAHTILHLSFDSLLTYKCIFNFSKANMEMFLSHVAAKEKEQALNISHFYYST